MISVLCVNEDSIYKTIPGVDAWDKVRNAYNFNGSNPVITHAPCQQWSRLKYFAKPDELEKELAWFCLEKVKANGGIFEHPANSSFFKEAGIKPTISINQHWFGLEARKTTWLYFHDVKPFSFPLNFNAVTHAIKTGMGKKNGLKLMNKKRHSFTTLDFAMWMINCIECS